ncbi:MAG: LysR family transcriptional regulator [Burkholderiales bacterium]|nr:LysR family transcriptional regulator [Burkholderiales bacterium]
MNNLTLHQLRCFDAVVTFGSFQAAADQLFRSQPTVFAAVKSLEAQIGVNLLDRSNYRVNVTEAGRAFHIRARTLLHEYAKLERHATQLSMGVESELRVVIGDLCPLAETLQLLRRFFDDSPGTQLHLHFEALSGPWERLREGDADLIFHHVDKSDSSLEYINLRPVHLIPVVAPGFLSFPIDNSITPDQMRDYVQCVIRDSARHTPSRSYYLLDGGRSWTVSDQFMKKTLILQGMGWGHMPDYMIEDEIRSGKLLSIAGQHLPGGQVDLVAARNRLAPHGPVAEMLWHYIAAQAPMQAWRN